MNEEINLKQAAKNEISLTEDPIKDEILIDVFVSGALSEATKKYWFEKFKQIYLKPEKVNRVEVINHNSVNEECQKVGRVFTHYDVNSCELDYQDDMKTLKIFI